MRLAWFSPLAPVPSGIATYTAIILPRLATRHEIDVFVDTDVWAVGGPAQAPPARDADGYLTVTSYGCHIRSAHDFVPKHSVRPYDLVVYQLGNARCHDYQWPYLLRHPGLVVLHDAQLHQSRAAALLQQKRPEDYRGEFAFSHHDAPEHVTDWVISGLGNAAAGLYPLTGLVLETARSVAVHHPRLATSLLDEHATVAIGTIRLGTPDLLDPADPPRIGGDSGGRAGVAAPIGRCDGPALRRATRDHRTRAGRHRRDYWLCRRSGVRSARAGRRCLFVLEVANQPRSLPPLVPMPLRREGHGDD